MNALIVLITVVFVSGYAYTVPGQNKARYDLMVEQTRSVELDNKIKEAQLAQLQLQNSKG